MENSVHPLVSVSVITYNSSKTIVETLDSIYNQTYPNLELIISDDNSTDNTIAICQQWLSNNSSRFKRTELIKSPTNTGTAANLNRAETACLGEWVKGIAGDDLLLPRCIETCMDFAKENPNLLCFFGKVRAFGGDSEYCDWLTKTLSDRNDLLSTLNREELITKIINNEPPPAPSFFYNRLFFINNHITNDERIPLLEDIPKWLCILRKGFVFGFLNKTVVKYRVGGISTTEKWQSHEVYRNKRLLYYYYQLDNFYPTNSEDTIKKIVDHECEVYRELVNCQTQLNNIQKSFSYLIVKKMLSPVKIIKMTWGRMKE